ncbi:MAG: LCP family protein [Herpetosiphon sp.]|nr:LCP family protein [Herpetosiphon sp.]
MALPPKSPTQPSSEPNKPAQPASNPSRAHQPPANWNTGATQKMPTQSAPPASAQSGQPRPVPRAAAQTVAAKPAAPTAPMPTQTQTPPAPPHHRSRATTCGMIALGALIVMLLIGGGVGLWAWNKFQTTADRIRVDVPTSVPDPSGQLPPSDPNQPIAATPDIVKDPFNILVVGVDIRENESDARTDTIIVVHVDPAKQWASMTSIPRDTCAAIPGFTMPNACERINAAYEYGYDRAIEQRQSEPSIGGMALTRDTVQKLLGIKIDHIVQVDFKGFKKIVDSIGGISINVQKPLWDASYPSDDNDNGLIRLYIPAGYQHMDGTTALRYARSRHQDADYGRSQRQQDVIRAIIQTLKNKGLLDQIDALDQLSKDLEGSFYTTLPIDDVTNLRALASLGSQLASGRIISVKWDTESISGCGDALCYIPIWDPDSIKATVRALLAGPTPETTTPNTGANPTKEPAASGVSIEVMNGAQIRGLAGDVEVHINNLGFKTSGTSTAPNVYDTTRILDFGNNKAERDKLAKALGIKSKYVTVISERNPAEELPTSPETGILLLLGRDYQEAWREP